MESGSWEKVKELYEAALKYSSDERVRFLEKECNGDDELRREVESLLNYSDGATSFLEQPAVGTVAEDIVASQNAGIREGNDFGHYRIIKKLGAGGMGEVYLAKDTILNRHVALKILLPEIAKDDDRVRRFKLEARAASALNHPNIVTIYEIGEAEDKLFIAYEYVDGQTLREKIVGNQLTVFGALKIAKQIADALAVTHEAGVVHRDIKPENIMVRRDGYVKILDFGLAKRRIFNSDSEDETLEQIKTQRGIILGSIQYMSPEQARGEETDERTDIWSLGVCLYEMLTGKNPFAGKTISDSIAAILHLEPEPLRKIIGGISEELEKIINKTLRKNLFERYQSINEFLVDLKPIDLQNRQISFDNETLELAPTVDIENEDNTESREIPQPTQQAKSITGGQNKTKTQETTEPNLKEKSLRSLNYRIWIIMSLPFLLAIFGVFRSEIGNFIFTTFIAKSEPHFESIQISQLTYDGAATANCAISPDGKFVAYVKNFDSGGESLVVRQVSTGSLLEVVPASNITIHSLSFNATGDFVYYFVNNKDQNNITTKINTLFKVPTLGGPSKLLLADPHVDSKITFSPDGRKMAFIKYNDTGTGVFIADSEGLSQDEVLSNTEAGVDRINTVEWLPDGNRLMLTVSNGENRVSKIVRRKDSPIGRSQFALFDVKEKNFKLLGKQNWYSIDSVKAPKSKSGVVFLGQEEKKDTTQIWYFSIPTETPVQITTDSNGFTSLDISDDGKTMVAIKGEMITSTLYFDPVTKGFKYLKRESKVRFVNEGISLAPDGKILFSKRVGTTAKIFSMDENGNNEKQITFDDGDDVSPATTRDGNYILFSSNRSGAFCIWRINSDGTNPLPLTNIEKGMDMKIEIMPDGQTVLFSRQLAEGSGVRKISVNGGESEFLIPNKDKFSYWNPKISPDGKYLAYLDSRYDAEAQKSVYAIEIVEFNKGQVGRLVKEKKIDFFNETFQWSPDSKSLTYIKTGAANLSRFSIKDDEETQLTDFSSGGILNYLWSADGKRIFIIRAIVNYDLVLIKDETK